MKLFLFYFTFLFVIYFAYCTCRILPPLIKELNETKVSCSVLNWLFTHWLASCICVSMYMCACTSLWAMFRCIKTFYVHPNEEWFKLKVVDRNLLMSNEFWGMCLVILFLYNSMFICFVRKKLPCLWTYTLE